MTLNERIYTQRVSPHFHAMLAAMLGREPLTSAKYVGKATVTSDGFIMCGFEDADGDYHHGAFVAGYSEVERNMVGLAKHLKVKEDKLLALLRSWIATDYRSAR